VAESLRAVSATRILRIAARFDGFLATVVSGILILLVAAMTTVVFLQVFYRYFLAQSLSWSEELARYLFVWISLLGAALAVQKRGHFGMELFYDMLPAQARRIARIVISLLMGTAILVILVQGLLLYQKVAHQYSPAMGISMGLAYGSLPVGAGLMAVHLLVILFRDVFGEDEMRP